LETLINKHVDIRFSAHDAFVEWNNLHQVRSMSKGCKANEFKKKCWSQRLIIDSTVGRIRRKDLKKQNYIY